MGTDFNFIDEPYDLDVSAGDLATVSDREQVLQAVTAAILTIQGEWEYDFTMGVPWTTGMFSIEQLRVWKEAQLTNTILNVPNVKSLEQLVFSVDPSNHGGFVAYKATTSFGPIAGEVAV